MIGVGIALMVVAVVGVQFLRIRELLGSVETWRGISERWREVAMRHSERYRAMDAIAQCTPSRYNITAAQRNLMNAYERNLGFHMEAIAERIRNETGIQGRLLEQVVEHVASQIVISAQQNDLYRRPSGWTVTFPHEVLHIRAPYGPELMSLQDWKPDADETSQLDMEGAIEAIDWPQYRKETVDAS